MKNMWLWFDELSQFEQRMMINSYGNEAIYLAYFRDFNGNLKKF